MVRCTEINEMGNGLVSVRPNEAKRAKKVVRKSKLVGMQ